MASIDHKLTMAKRCAHEGVIAGAKAAVVATVATAIPTLASTRMLPWARTYLNHTAQALIISSVAGAAYFIVADKTEHGFSTLGISLVTSSKKEMESTEITFPATPGRTVLT